jgi:excisionase family DNA binding protein
MRTSGGPSEVDWWPSADVGANALVADRETSPFGRRVRDMTEALLTANEVAAMLGVPASWVYEQSRAGRIPTVTLGRYRRYRRQAIEAWLEQLESSDNGHRSRAA